MKFQFSIRTSLKESWEIFKQTPWFFVGLAAIIVALNFAGGEWSPNIVLILTAILAFIMSYVMLSVSLAAVDGKKDLLQFSSFRQHLPTVRQFFMLFLVGLVTGFFVILGLVALIIPGIYIAIRLMFTNLAYVDRKGRVMQTLRYSWKMVKGDVFWTVFLAALVNFGLLIAGVLLLGVGFLVLYPVSIIFMAKLYRALTLHHDEQSLVVRPEEITAPQE